MIIMLQQLITARQSYYQFCISLFHSVTDRESLSQSYKAHTMDHGHMTYDMARECYDIVMETSLTVSVKTTRLVMTIVTQIEVIFFLIV